MYVHHATQGPSTRTDTGGGISEKKKLENPLAPDYTAKAKVYEPGSKRSYQAPTS
jgi:hypothetical protein